jgi:8-oxo-dGTP diphosphatase
MEVLYQLS